MAWTYLVIAGILEIVWAIGLKYTDAFSRLWPSIVTVLAMIGSFYYLSQALKTLPAGTGYAIYTGIGAVVSATLGIVLFSESAALSRLLSIALIVIGIIGLKLTAQ